MIYFIAGLFIGAYLGMIVLSFLNARRIDDRRTWNPARFPLIDSEGELALADRRSQPDRRLKKNIVLRD